MRTLISSILWRYLAIALQFGLVILIAHRTKIDIAGTYFALFGFVTVTVLVVGLGIPDGLVRHLPASRLSASSNKVNSIVIRSIAVSIGISGLIAVVGYFVALPFVDFDGDITLLTGAWWLAYAVNFLFAQVLVALGRPAVGAFVVYSSINIGYAFTLIPFILIVDNITLPGLLYAANAGTWAAVLLGCGLVVHRAKSAADCETRNSRAASLSSEVSALSVLGMLSTGFPIMLGRLMQSSLAWIPVWILITFVSAEESAIYSAASRFTVAVTSVVAALRFSVRPTIVELNMAARYSEIAIFNRKCSMISAVPPIVGIVVLLVAGHVLVPLALGHEYADVNRVLLVLMFGVLAEAFGGMSDEILKMTGRTRIVLCTLVLAVLLQLCGSYILAQRGAQAVAFATVTAFVIQYVGQVLWLSLKTPIKILPLRLASHQ